jgi:hypothetical protein
MGGRPGRPRVLSELAAIYAVKSDRSARGGLRLLIRDTRINCRHPLIARVCCGTGLGPPTGGAGLAELRAVDHAALRDELLGALEAGLQGHVAALASRGSATSLRESSRSAVAHANAITPSTPSASGAPILTVFSSSKPGSWITR